MEGAFKIMKTILATDVLVACPNHCFPFHIHVDASDYQMGAVAVKQKRPVAYWSQKLTTAQENYHTIEKELLSIVVVCDELSSMRLSPELFICNNHTNLTVATFNCHHVLCSPLAFIHGRVCTHHPLSSLQEKSHLPQCDVLSIPEGENVPIFLFDFTENGISISNVPELFECFFNLPFPDVTTYNSVDFNCIHE